MLITIDLRMYRMSGIGRYLQTLMPEVVPRLNFSRIRVLGDPGSLVSESWMRDSRIECQRYQSPIFSISEQLRGPKHTWGSDVLWVPQYNIPLVHRGKIVVTIHDICQLAHPESLGSNLQRQYARFLLSCVAKRSKAILCDSMFTKDEVRKYLDIEESRLFVVYPGLGLTPDPASSSVGNSCQDYLLAVGNIKKHKNLRTLIAAFSIVKDRIPHDLVIVGKRDGFLNSENAFGSAATLLDGRVRFTGYISDQELRSYYRGAAALVFPSLYEGFGYPLVEAMVQSCPVACSNAASLPEVAGDAALLFDPLSVDSVADALIAITSDTELRTRLIQGGLKRVERFNARTCAEQTAEVINRVSLDA